MALFTPDSNSSSKWKAFLSFRPDGEKNGIPLGEKKLEAKDYGASIAEAIIHAKEKKKSIEFLGKGKIDIDLVEEICYSPVCFVVVD